MTAKNKKKSKIAHRFIKFQDHPGNLIQRCDTDI